MNDQPLVFPPATCAESGAGCSKIYEKICLQCLKALCGGHFPQGSHQCREPEDRSVHYKKPEPKKRRKKPPPCPPTECPPPCQDGCAKPPPGTEPSPPA